MNVKNTRLLRYFGVMLLWTITSAGGHRTAGQESAEIFIEMTRSSVDAGWSDTFLHVVETRLAEDGFIPIFIDDPAMTEHAYFWERPSLHLDVLQVGQHYRILVTPYTTMRLPLSPALVAVSDVSLALFLAEGDEDAYQDALNLISALALYTHGQWAEAQQRFEQLAQDETLAVPYPEVHEALRFYVATCLLMQDATETAERGYAVLLPQTITDGTASVAVVRNLSWIYLHTGQTERIWPLFDALITAAAETGDDDTRMDALVGRAHLYAVSFRYDDAIGDVTHAIDIATSDEHPPAYLATLYVLRGQFTLLLYEWDRALHDFNTALTLDPASTDAIFQRGLLYYSVLERQPALADFETYLSLNPRGAHAAEAQRYVALIQEEVAALRE